MYDEKYGVTGLSGEEAAEKAAAGLSNLPPRSAGKTTGKIILTNSLTYFNFIFAIIAVLLAVVGSFRNLTFLPVVIGNTLVGIIQEIRAKKIIDKMNLLNAPHALVIRDGQRLKVRSEELVAGDTVIFSAGDQICADARVIAGSVSVNEALLTGEQDEITKQNGASLLSGSFVVSGECAAVLEKVGEASYISKLTSEAKNIAGGEQSEMIRAINKIVMIMGIALIPIGGILFYQNYYVANGTLRDSVTAMATAVIGMIPEGLYLLTTAALALGTIRLAKNKVLLNDMKSIEALARVDTLCVDKTGTITEPTMEVRHVISVAHAAGTDESVLAAMISEYVSASQDNNATMEALRAYFSSKSYSSDLPMKNSLSILPFSSALKYGAITFEDGTYILGAPEFVLTDGFSAYSKQIERYTKKGYRVLAFAHTDGGISGGEIGTGAPVTPLGFVILSNAIRENAEKTFRYFAEQGVNVKVISGDNPETVSEIARLAGISGYDSFVDASTLAGDAETDAAATKYTVFGRVTPKQKQIIVRALQSAGHTVAMTGDGVNDILAMKDADCGIAMASGSEAVSQVADVVLMDSDFAHMPDVVAEGRRVVNNVERSASLFLVKNIFSLLLSIMVSVLMIPYPLEPTHISLIGMFTIGVPGFLLALETNKNRIEGNFLKKVLLRAFPAGLTDALIVGSLAVFGNVFKLPKDDVATASTLLLATVGFLILWKICMPATKYRLFVFFVNILGIVLTVLLLPSLFSITMIPVTSIHLTLIFSFAAESIFRILTWLCDVGFPRLKANVGRKKNKKKD